MHKCGGDRGSARRPARQPFVPSARASAGPSDNQRPYRDQLKAAPHVRAAYAFDAAIRVADCASLLTGEGRRGHTLAPATEVGDEVLARPDCAAGSASGVDLTVSPYALSHGRDR